VGNRPFVESYQGATNLFHMATDTVERGYAQFLNQLPLLHSILDSNKIDESNFESLWKLWLGETLAWLTNVFPNRFLTTLPHAKLPKDLQRNGGCFSNRLKALIVRPKEAERCWHFFSPALCKHETINSYPIERGVLSSSRLWQTIRTG
jgi:hypothetical protein